MPRLRSIALGLALVLSAGAITALWHLRTQALDSQERELGLLALALSDDIQRGLQGAEEGFQALRVELHEHRLAVTGAEAARALRTRAELMPLVKTLWLVDLEGRILVASDDSPVPELASFAPALPRLADDGVAVSRPFMGAGSASAQVALAVRFAAEPGQPGGWIVAALPADALLGAFTVASPAPDAKMAVFRSDGVRLAGTIVEHPLNDEARLARRLATAPSLEARRFRDGSDRLVSLNSLPRYGLQLMLTRDQAAALEPWREATRLTGAALALILVTMGVAVILVQRADRRHALARQALDSQRARASKLEALGTLAGGVAHDFNNILAAIIGFAEISLEAAPSGGDQARRLEKLLQAALRGRALVERILAFSRGGARASMGFELEPVVAEVLTLLTAALRPGIVLERRLDSRGARLRGDPTQAFEAVMNLCTNAMEAMPAGGTLSVQLERAHIAAPRVLSHTQLAAGDYVVLSVADQGQGIRTEVMEHLFEPFFTTRADRSGTGLGLAVVHGVVTEFGGAIDVHSRLGKGSRFTLYFPQSAQAMDTPAPAPAPVADRGGAGQTLLVVDDDPTLVALAEEMLAGLGYLPVGFTDPAAALRALQLGPRRFAAVITDEVMPGLSGTQLTEAVRALAPHVPVLLVSGFGGPQLATRAAAVGVTRVLAKPLQRADLARALGDLLQ